MSLHGAPRQMRFPIQQTTVNWRFQLSVIFLLSSFMWLAQKRCMHSILKHDWPNKWLSLWMIDPINSNSNPWLVRASKLQFLVVLDSKVVETVQISGPTVLLLPNASAKYDKGGIPLDPKTLTKISFFRAINLSNSRSRGTVCALVCQLIPDWWKCLTVDAPRHIKFDESCAHTDHGIKVTVCQLEWLNHVSLHIIWWNLLSSLTVFCDCTA